MIRINILTKKYFDVFLFYEVKLNRIEILLFFIIEYLIKKKQHETLVLYIKTLYITTFLSLPQLLNHKETSVRILIILVNKQTGHKPLKIVNMESIPHLVSNVINVNGDTDLIFKEEHVFKMSGIVLNIPDKINHNVHNVFKDTYCLTTSVTEVLGFVKNTIMSLIHVKNVSQDTFYKTQNASLPLVKVVNTETLMDTVLKETLLVVNNTFHHQENAKSANSTTGKIQQQNNA